MSLLLLFNLSSATVSGLLYTILGAVDDLTVTNLGSADVTIIPG